MYLDEHLGKGLAEIQAFMKDNGSLVFLIHFFAFTANTQSFNDKEFVLKNGTPRNDPYSMAEAMRHFFVNQSETDLTSFSITLQIQERIL